MPIIAEMALDVKRKNGLFYSFIIIVIQKTRRLAAAGF